MRIDVRDVTVAYDGIPALTNVTLSFEGSGVVMLTGPTGAGKTTLLRLLYADLLPTQGAVLIDDIATSSMKQVQRRAMRRRQGIVQQSCRLVSDYSVFDNVLMPYALAGLSKADATRSCLDLLADMNISYVRHKFPHQLSGGERHLVALARAIASKPELLIADEPTGTLDEATSAHVASTLHSCVTHGMGLIISTHSANLLSAFPQATVCTITEGVLTVDSTHSTIEVQP
ncbi:MAG: ATP-binding cassette domain-containing protein [Candidatus Kapabacteria bacterium]|nr:ATP-binding cassette domain-containing protein [Candidatus Kapabacteria bacterium]